MARRRRVDYSLPVAPAAPKQPFDWGSWMRSFGVWGLGIIGVLVTFYFTTTATLREHDKQFVEVGKQFEKFNATLMKNYDDWAKVNKEEAATRERQRERFETLFKDFGMNTAAMKVQVETLTKTLDGVSTKIDSIQGVQRERVLQDQQRGRR